MVFRIDYYTPEELTSIVKRSAQILKVEVDDAGAWEIASRARGTPRVAIRFLRRVRDYAQVKEDGVITKDAAHKALALMEIDHLGLDNMDRKILRTVIEKFGGGPVGIDTLATAISEEKDTIEDVYEPFLIQKGYINRTPRGRVATRLAYEYLGVDPKDSVQGELFK